ncbi:LIC_10907 family protein [Leptospira stimsonii]|uniref:Uncharacterized protein n=1 Tax=Leptospira stimsonii TaxID=2202203 RepID=A0A396YTS6_9LEPT|nr:hypothetical protein DLM75_22240 [Leptospira stimsonii]
MQNMPKWYDLHELENSLGSLPILRRKIAVAAKFRTIKETLPKELKIYIFTSRLILKKRILKRKADWYRNELKVIFSEKISLQNKLHEAERIRDFLVEENRELTIQIERLKSELSKT